MLSDGQCEVPIGRASWSLVRFRSLLLSHCPRCEHATEGDVLMQIGILADLGTAPRNLAGVHVDGSSVRRPGMRSRNASAVSDGPRSKCAGGLGKVRRGASGTAMCQE